MTLHQALSRLPPHPHALDWLIAGIGEGLSIGAALVFAWGQYHALNQQRRHFVKGIRE